jgi:hypothetical protein
MENFFTPTRRLQDRQDLISNGPHGYTEVQLAVSIEEFLNRNWNWSDLYAFAKCDEDAMMKLMWITEDTIIWVEDENTLMDFGHALEDEYHIRRATFTATSGETHELVLAADVESAFLPACRSVQHFLACNENKQLCETKIGKLVQLFFLLGSLHPLAISGSESIA